MPCRGWDRIRALFFQCLGSPESVRRAGGGGLGPRRRCVGAGSHYITVCLEEERLRSLRQRLGENRIFQARRRYPVVRYAPARLLRTGVTPRGSGCRRSWHFTARPPTATLRPRASSPSPGRRCHTAESGRPLWGAVRELLAYCGLREDPQYLILGDLMTGRSSPTDDLPVLPGMTCLLALKLRPVVLPQGACIGCGRCVRACHAGLLPYEIVRRLENMHYERARLPSPGRMRRLRGLFFRLSVRTDVAVRVQEAAGTHGTIFPGMG